MRNIIFKTLFGSRMYGTANYNSDTDYKGIFFISKSDMLLARYEKSFSESIKNSNGIKNTAEDIDAEYFSLQYFGNLAFNGETVAIDMLCAPRSAWLRSSFAWEKIYEDRNKFLSKNIISFVNYSQKQAAKYGIKGSRLNICNEIINELNKYDKRNKIINNLNFFDELNSKYPDEFIIIKKYNEDNTINSHESKIKVVGKEFLLTSPSFMIIDSLSKFVNEYGARAIQASKNEGIDWKAIHHAFRFAYLVDEIIDNNGMVTFPLKETDFLIKVKNKEYNFVDIQPKLEELIKNTLNKLIHSSLPDIPDKEWYNKRILDFYKYELTYDYSYDIIKSS